MLFLLSVAEDNRGSDSALSVPLICIGVIVAIALLALLPLFLGSLRRHRAPQALLGVSILWAAISIGVSINAIMQQNKWASERQLRVNSGYYDPKDNSAAPPLPVEAAAVLAAAYAAVLLWAVTAAGRAPPPPES